MSFPEILMGLTVLVKNRRIPITVRARTSVEVMPLKKILYLITGLSTGLPQVLATKPTDYINRVIDEITTMLTETVFKGALLVIVIAAIYYLLGIDPEKRDMAKRAFWYALLAIVIVKTAPALISWLRGV